MKKFVVTSFGLLLAISAASPVLGQLDLKFNGNVNNDFLTSGNWSEVTFPGGVPTVTPVAAVPGALDRANINDTFVVSYGGGTTTVTSLIVGGDAPQQPGDFGTPGRLNMSAGELIVSGGGDSFQIGRACCNNLATDVSVVELTNSAILRTFGNDPQVGTRDAGHLIIRDTASVIGDGGNSHWRLGNYGPSIDVGVAFPNGLAGNGFLDVRDNGSFSAHVIFLGDQDSTGKLRISDNGSVKLTGSLVPNIATGFPNRSARVEMIGSNATLEAVFNLESANGALEVHNQYYFEAGSGVSKIKLGDAVNIDNNDLTVNLAGWNGHLGDKLLLFDAAPNRVFGAFASLTIQNEHPSDDYTLVYDHPNGDILLMNREPGRRGPRPNPRGSFANGNGLLATGVPEPSTMFLLGLGMVMVISAKRRASR